VTDDQRMYDFVKAVYETGKPSRGRVAAGQIMPHLDLDPQNLTDEDERLYMRVAQRCAEAGYIYKRADRYQVVEITESGKQYVERGL
jgi:DNA-binding MarR family transcriptional regulator